jgi:hypothetical protein
MRWAPRIASNDADKNPSRVRNSSGEWVSLRFIFRLLELGRQRYFLTTMKGNFTAGLALSILLICCAAGTAQTTEKDWQTKAVFDYPDLAVQGSEMNSKYIQKVRSLRQTDPAFFENPRWPYTLAEEVSKKAIIPGLEEHLEPAGHASPKMAYVDNQRVEVVDAKDLVAKGKQGQRICVEGVVVNTTQRKMSAKDSFTLKLSPNIFCEFLVEPFIMRNRSLLPSLGSYSSEAKIVVEDDGLSIYAPPGYKKKAIKVGAILKPGEKVIISGQFTGAGNVGVDQGYLITDCVLARPIQSSYSSQGGFTR